MANSRSESNLFSDFKLKSLENIPPLDKIVNDSSQAKTIKFEFWKTLWMCILAILLVYAFVDEHDYYYYYAIRFLVTISFAYWTFTDLRRLYFTGLLGPVVVVIFNPILKFSFERNTWQTIDLAVAGLLAYSAIYHIVIWKKLSKKLESNSMQVKEWLNEIFYEISTGKWGYHLSMAELRKNTKLNNTEKAEISAILNRKYEELSEEEKRTDYEKYHLAIILYHPDSPFTKI